MHRSFYTSLQFLNYDNGCQIGKTVIATICPDVDDVIKIDGEFYKIIDLEYQVLDSTHIVLEVLPC